MAAILDDLDDLGELDENLGRQRRGHGQAAGTSKVSAVTGAFMDRRTVLCDMSATSPTPIASARRWATLTMLANSPTDTSDRESARPLHNGQRGCSSAESAFAMA